jgi:aryl-alcohol dehydrogenase-like predicted oxidoreductase
MRSVLGVGTATLIAGYGVGQTGRIESPLELLRRAIESGVLYIDTAPVYQDAEVVLGDLQPLLRLTGVRICSKADGRNTARDIKASVQASLNRLRCDSIDTLLIHSATEEVLRTEDVIEGLNEVKQAGLARRVGASTYGAKCAELALLADWCDVVQIEFSVINQSVLQAVSREHVNKEVIARSVLCKGLLTPRRSTMRNLPPDVARRIDDLERLAHSWGLNLPELGIRFALDSQNVDVVLVGLSSEEELNTALRAYSSPPLDQNQLEILSGFDCSSFDCVHPERWT